MRDESADMKVIFVERLDILIGNVILHAIQAAGTAVRRSHAAVAVIFPQL
jgi:hypothetical protein